MRRSVVRPLALLAVVALPFTACGDDDDDDTSSGAGSGSGSPSGPEPSGEVVTVVAESVSGFDSESYSAPAGEVTIRFANADSIPHDVTIDDPEFHLEEDGAEDTIELEAGEYTLYCSVSGHRDAGMEATLTVE